MGLAALIMAIGGPIMSLLELLGVNPDIAGEITTVLAAPFVAVALVLLLPLVGVMSIFFG